MQMEDIQTVYLTFILFALLFIFYKFTIFTNNNPHPLEFPVTLHGRGGGGAVFLELRNTTMLLSNGGVKIIRVKEKV